MKTLATLLITGCALALGACERVETADTNEAGTANANQSLAARERAAARAGVDVSLTRLDCGEIEVSDLNVFSVDDAYSGQTKRLVDSCYLIRHGDDVMLWDTGLPAALKGQEKAEGPFTMRLGSTISDQLIELGLTPADVDYVGISHFHDDHTGQLADYPGATLLTGQADWGVILDPPPQANAAPYQHWVSGGGTVQGVTGDHDVFGDGSVVMVALPGHTPGHNGLRVRLKELGTVLLSGDVVHFTENYASNGVPDFNTDPAKSRESIQRFKDMARDYFATVVIQHEPADVEKLPAFPAAAD